MTDRSSAGPSPSSGPYIWSEAVHESWGREQLTFWRLSFAPSYVREDILRRVGDLFDSRNVTSFAVYEVFGTWDLLIRAWLPLATRVEEFDSALHRELRSHSLDSSEYLTVGHTARHWLWEGVGPRQRAAEPPSAPAVEEVDRRNLAYIGRSNDLYRIGADQARGVDGAQHRANADVESELADLIADGLLKEFDPDRNGIKFYIVWGIPKRALRPQEKDVALQQIMTTCERVIDQTKSISSDGRPPEVSIYTGSGTMTNFLILAKAPDRHFYSFARDLVFSLTQATNMDVLYGSRPYTHVLAHRRFIGYRDTIPVESMHDRDSDRLADEIAMLIDEEESERLEFKATVSADTKRFFATGDWESFGKGPDQVVKAVCGLLNAPLGGTLILGVQEVDRIKDRIRDAEDRLAEFPSSPRGTKLILGMKPDQEVLAGISDWDSYRLRIAEHLERQIRPVAAPYISILHVDYMGEDLTVIKVRPASDDWFFGDVDGTERFYARELGRTREYRGPDMTSYQRAHVRGRWRDS